MRHACVIVSLLFILSTAADAAEKFPYSSQITGDNVYVRSGPGKSYYATDKLPRGRTIQVWRHDPGGWFAVRPPAGSFSWIRTKYLKATDDEGIFTINSDRVIARVGTKFSEARDVIQVRLDRGEEVEVLDTVKAEGQQWHKIAPPAGEFRWVFGRYVDRSAQVSKAEPSDRRRNLLVKDEPKTSDDPVQQKPKRAGRPAARRIVVDKPAKPIRAERDPDDEVVRIADEEDSDTEEIKKVTFEQEEIADPRPTPRRISRRISRDTKALPLPRRGQALAGLEGEVDRLDLKLSQMVSQEPDEWNFDAITSRADQLLDAAKTALDRGRIRRLQSRLHRFQVIKDRYDTVHTIQKDTDKKNAELTSATTPVRRKKKIESRFDGMGKLMPNVRRAAGMPPFVLMDDTGKPVVYVSPAPGVNLRRYVGHQIGVNGPRGFIPKLDAQQVMAKYVQILDAKKTARDRKPSRLR